MIRHGYGFCSAVFMAGDAYGRPRVPSRRLLFFAFFLLAGVANALSRAATLALDALMTGFKYLICIGLLLDWLQSVRARLLTSRAKRWMMGAALLMLLYRMPRTPALVADGALRPVCRSGGALEADGSQLRAALASQLYLTPDLKLSGHKLRGGYAFRIEDEVGVRRAQERLLDANELIESENSLIRAEALIGGVPLLMVSWNDGALALAAEVGVAR